NTSGSVQPDTTNGTIVFTDPDVNDHPIASRGQQTVIYQDLTHHIDYPLTLDQILTFKNGFSTSPTGNWTYSIPDSQLDFLNADEVVTVISTVQISDGHGGTVDQDVTVTIDGADDSPVISSNGTVTGNITKQHNTPGSTL